MAEDTSISARQKNIAEHVIDKDGLVWRIVRDGGMATRADYNGIVLIGIKMLEDEHAPLIPLSDLLMRVEINDRVGQPKTCKVWYDDVLKFDGVDRSVLLQHRTTDIEGNEFVVKTADEETPDEGHTFRITVTNRGSSKVVGDEHSKDSDWWGPEWPIEVRAWNLRDALLKAARLPFSRWVPDYEKHVEQPQGGTDG